VQFIKLWLASLLVKGRRARESSQEELEQFTNPGATNHARRFYQLGTPLAMIAILGTLDSKGDNVRLRAPAAAKKVGEWIFP
jgi:hypothetical protein